MSLNNIATQMSKKTEGKKITFSFFLFFSASKQTLIIIIYWKLIFFWML
jgi:hypothetical protein